MNAQPLSRRARYRAATQEEAKDIALRQLANGGIEAVSLKAISTEMGVTGPALYRYFANRDALLTELIIDAYTDFAATVTAVAQQNENSQAQERLRSLARCFRAWALAQPHRYLLIYGTPIPGYTAPDSTRSLAGRILTPFLEALGALAQTQEPASTGTNPHLTALEAQLTQWANFNDQAITNSIARQGLVWWTRLHGLVSLEVEGHFVGMGFDPALLFESEIDALVG